jgi:uncharacterized membrane protein (UPF0127 family)
VQIDNLTRGQNLVSDGRMADNMWTRMKGLIGSQPLQPGEGLVILPCNSIHTHFMGFSIDVLYVNKSHEVVAEDRAMPPWRFGRIHRSARYVIELPPGSIDSTGTQPGDQLQVQGHEF